MKKTLIIVTVVTGYALIETVLLLSSVVPHISYSPGTFQKVVLGAQLLLIPGMAALFSRIIYGSHRFGRRAMLILLAGLLSVPVALIVGIIFILLPLVLLIWAFSVSKILFAVLLPVVLGAVTAVLLSCVRKSGKWSVEAEAVRWLAERSNTSQRERKWRTRSIPVASCIPALTVLVVFLFLPETWGVLSHFSYPRAGNLPGYRVNIPITWIVFYQHREDGDLDGRSGVNGFVGQGIGLGGNPFRHEALSYWRVWTNSLSQPERSDRDWWPPKADEIVSRRAFRIGDAQIECLDYGPSYLGTKQSDTLSLARVECMSAGRLQASFDGSRNHLPKFYRMLASIKQAQ